jgi:hypothetical protein
MRYQLLEAKRLNGLKCRQTNFLEEVRSGRNSDPELFVMGIYGDKITPNTLVFKCLTQDVVVLF